MTRYFLLLPFLLFIVACTSQPEPPETVVNTEGPLSLNPENPHYLMYHGEPTILITSAEHYGAVINLDFDYSAYLQTLARDGMNYTRIFTGSYYEIYGESFGIEKNTLAPKPGRLITPWFQNAEGKYDLTKWNPDYFNRLKAFLSEAAALDIFVEVTLFSSIYRDEHWDISPQNPANTINMDVELARENAQTLNNGPLLEYQEMMVRKLTEELNEFDNFFFEIQNEPWSDHAVPVYNIVNKEDLLVNDWTNKSDFADAQSMEWQEHIARIIRDTESALPKQHLIAQNYTNFRASIPEVSPLISIINFHYAWPEAVQWNYHFDKVIGFDESGFAGSGDQVYRRQAWQFILSGGGIFNNLDYSFYPDHEDGLGENNAPGGGSPELRKQLRILSEFIHDFPLEKMYPDYSSVKASPGLITYALSDNTTHWALYIRATGTDSSTLTIAVPDGTYTITKLDPVSGESMSATTNSEEGLLNIAIEISQGELALRIERGE